MDELYRDTGAAWLKKPFFIIALVIIAIGLSIMVAKMGIVGGAFLIIVPFGVYFLVKLLMTPKLGIIVTIITSFLAIGLTRYISGIKFGLSTDILLSLTFFSLFIGGWKKLDWSNARNDLTFLSLLWMAYTLMELVNPEAVSAQAWFYAMRGVGFYMVLMVPLGFMLFTKVKDLDLFFKLWMLFSILATIKGLQQVILKPDPWEQAWLDGGGDLTHVLFGRLRAFSFFSDAGQFGAAQAHMGLVALIIALGPGNLKKKIRFGALALIGFVGMLYSGTRGALFVPAAGIFLFLFLSKNFKVFSVGLVAGMAVFFVLKFTTIGAGVYQIQRMRTALDPNDKSFQVRLENQRKLKVYMKSRPIGGGIGSAGNWGMRFSPNTFLAQTPTDSWYVKIWAEMGIVGLVLHLAMLLYILIKSSLIIWFKLKDPEFRQIMIALVSGYFGIMVAAYGNGILGQMPTATILYLSWVFLFTAPKLEPYYASYKNKWKVI